MATHTAQPGAIAIHAVTLGANTVETFAFADDLDAVDIISDGAAAIYYTLDRSNPTIGGANTYLLPAGGIAIDTRQPPTSGPTQVQMLSAGTPTVSVQRA